MPRHATIQVPKAAPKVATKIVPKVAAKVAPKVAPKPSSKKQIAYESDHESLSSLSDAESNVSHPLPSPSESDCSEATPVQNAPPKTRGRPKTKESYDTSAYSKKFRETAPCFTCPSCDVTVSYFSKSRHLKSAKHLAHAHAER